MDWLAWVEYSYNISYHFSLHTKPFKVVYGRSPPKLLTYYLGISKEDAVNVALKSRDEVLNKLQKNLLKAQQNMKNCYDAKHRHVEFNVGDKVLLKLQPYQKLSLASRKHQKLLPKYYGPFTVLDSIGPMAYKLDLPSATCLHPVFHVSCLKPFHENFDATI